MKLKPYPEYKTSGVPWLGKIPTHWTSASVKRHYAIQLGKMLQGSPASEVDRPVPYLKAQHVQWFSVRTEDLPTMWVHPREIEKYRVLPGDLLVCEGGEGGRCGIVRDVPDSCIIQNALHRVRVGSTSSLTYLQYVMNTISASGWFNAINNKATISHFTHEKFGALGIPVPPQEEQNAITMFLAHTDRHINRLIRAKQRLIELLNEQKQVTIHQAVTGKWEVRRVKGVNGEIASHFTPRPSHFMKPSGIDWLGDVPEHWSVAALRMYYSVELGKMLDAKQITGQYLVPYLRNVDVQWDQINTDDLPTMDIKPREYARFTLQPGDMLVCEGGEVGRSAFWHGQLLLCGFQKALHRLRPLNAGRDAPRFLFYFMYTAAKRGVFMADGNENTIAHLTGEKLRAHRFVFPPKEEQGTIVRSLDEATTDISNAIDRATREIDLLREYRARLIADVVTGHLDVRRVELPALDEAEALAEWEIDEDTEADEMDEIEGVDA